MELLCKIENAETQFIYLFLCVCVCVGSPGDGGTCSQEFPGPGESHVFPFYRYMKHLQILQDKT